MKDQEELLDQFAAVALNGILANHELWRSLCADKASFSRNKNDIMEDYVAQQAYKIADAMIKEKEFLNGNHMDNLVPIAKANYLSKNGEIKSGIKINGIYYAHKKDIKQ